jgi:hypothetical protein
LLKLDWISLFFNEPATNDKTLSYIQTRCD